MTDSHAHHHHHTADMSEKALLWAIAINVILTIFELAGGFYANSLALLAEALHNFGDVFSLVVAFFARKIAKRPADERKTFGYHRAETVAALINLTILAITGIYLVGEAIKRFFSPAEVGGDIVIYTAILAIVFNGITAIILYKNSKDNLNMRAAFIHNITDVLGAVAIVISGVLIILYGWHVADLICTLLIAGYILLTCKNMMPKTIHILMEGAPEGIKIHDIVTQIEKVDGVLDAHHVYIWQPNEHSSALESHVIIDDLSNIETIKKNIKQMLKDNFNITHSTLEFEDPNDIPDDNQFV